MAVRQLEEGRHDLDEIGQEMNNASVADNLQRILLRIENASKRAEDSPYWRGQKPSLIAVSKMKSPWLIQ